MSILMWLISFLDSGVASFFTNGMETLHLKVEKKRIDLNLMNRELLTDLLKSTDAEEKSFSERLAMLKNIAHKLKNEGFTLTISYKGSAVLTLGSEAKPTFSQAVTRTDAIEINNLKQLMQFIA